MAGESKKSKEVVKKKPTRKFVKKVKARLKKVHITNRGKLYETVGIDGEDRIIYPNKSITIKVNNRDVLVRALVLTYPTLVIKKI